MHYRYQNIDILCLIKNKNNPNFTVTDSPGFAPDSLLIQMMETCIRTQFAGKDKKNYQEYSQT